MPTTLAAKTPTKECEKGRGGGGTKTNLCLWYARTFRLSGATYLKLSESVFVYEK